MYIERDVYIRIHIMNSYVANAGAKSVRAGSYMWCQHREREHTRLALMTLALEIFERRLLGAHVSYA